MNIQNVLCQLLDPLQLGSTVEWASWFTCCNNIEFLQMLVVFSAAVPEVVVLNHLSVSSNLEPVWDFASDAYL